MIILALLFILLCKAFLKFYFLVKHDGFVFTHIIGRRLFIVFRKKHEGGDDIVSKCERDFFPFFGKFRKFQVVHHKKFHGRISFSSKRDSAKERYTTS